MGLLSITTIVISLACLAMMIGLVFAVILLWPQKTGDHPDNPSDGSNQPDRRPSNHED